MGMSCFLSVSINFGISKIKVNITFIFGGALCILALAVHLFVPFKGR